MAEQPNKRSELVCKRKARPQAGLGRRGGVARARAEKQRRKRKLGGASAPKEGAPAASVRSGVAMGRGSGTFERLLDKATSQLLLETDWESILQICDLIRQGDTQ